MPGKQPGRKEPEMAENCKKALLIDYEDIVEVDVEGLDDLQRLVGGISTSWTCHCSGGMCKRPST